MLSQKSDAKENRAGGRGSKSRVLSRSWGRGQAAFFVVFFSVLAGAFDSTSVAVIR
jgi:hypothetical protein